MPDLFSSLPRLWTRTLVAGVALFGAACGDSSRVEITESRPRHTSEPHARLDVAYANSFPSAEQYRWTLPPGWKEVPRTQFRQANFVFGPQGEGECYISLIEGGDELSNINRWRQQMGQPPMTQDEADALPQINIFERPAKLVDVTGTYTGMAGMGEAPKENWRLRGLIRAEGGATLTVKMTGPADLIEKEAANFDAFVASLYLTPKPRR